MSHVWIADYKVTGYRIITLSICGGTVYTLVLETNAERIESSNLSRCTKYMDKFMQFMSKSEINVDDIIHLCKKNNIDFSNIDTLTFAYDILALHEFLKEQKIIEQKAASDKRIKESQERHREYHSRNKWNGISKGNWS